MKKWRYFSRNSGALVTVWTEVRAHSFDCRILICVENGVDDSLMPIKNITDLLLIMRLHFSHAIEMTGTSVDQLMQPFVADSTEQHAVETVIQLLEGAKLIGLSGDCLLHANNRHGVRHRVLGTLARQLAHYLSLQSHAHEMRFVNARNVNFANYSF